MKYLTDIVNKWDEHIRIQEDDLIDYERDLATLYEPFPNLLNLYRKELVKSQAKMSQYMPGSAEKPLNTSKLSGSKLGKTGDHDKM